ncbi:MAG: cytochrome c3 family protein [Desulfobacteraceae bacterium]|nr:cytochrome c3 family protein [Desulfobacteraceae bacterium]
MKVRIIFMLMLGTAALFLINNQAAARPKQEINSCLGCHADTSKMKGFGYPQFTITNEETQKQTKMPASCTDCHLGNPADPTKEGAHKGMLRPYYVLRSGGLQAVTRDKLERYKPESMEPRGENPLTELLPMAEKDGRFVRIPQIDTILFHDIDPETLFGNYEATEKTCGMCHQKEVNEFKKTAMGRNAKQSQYKTWTDKDRGPHNCGAWFADGYEKIAKGTNVPFTKGMASVNQKACNLCHVGCLDCHYTPRSNDPNDPAIGPHTFTKSVSAQSCYGGGRGSLCHAGPEERRRGAGYIGGLYANPKGAIPDIHYSKGLSCLDCHDTPAKDKTLLHGQVKRQVDCSKCHGAAVKSIAKSVHERVSCEACHIQDVGAYTATFWGPGKIAGVATPFFKYKKYYGVMEEPILIKDQRGRWIPVKPFINAVLNQKTAGNLKPGLAWRFPANLPDLKRTDDAYAFVGLLGGLPSDGDALAWIQMDKLSHKYGKARSCDSCHTKDGAQRQEVTWEYSDQGAEPFKGRHTVVADKNGLSIKDMRATTKIMVKDGWKIEDFAPWYYLKDKWHVKGDFSIPLVKDDALYKKELDRYEDIIKKGGIYHK